MRILNQREDIEMFDFYLHLICVALFVYKLWLLYVGKVNKEKEVEKVVEDFKRKSPCDGFDNFEEPLKKKLCVPNVLLYRVNIFFDPEFDTEDEIEDISSDDFDFDDLNSDAIEFINRDPRLHRLNVDEFLREHADRYVLPSANGLPMDVVSIASDSIVSVSSESIVSISSDSIVSVPSESIVSVSSEGVPGEMRGR